MSSVELVVDAGDGSTTLAASDVQVQQYREVRILLGGTTVVINTIQPQSANGFATLQMLIQGPSNSGNAAPSPASPQQNIEHPLQFAAAPSDSGGVDAEPSWMVKEKWAKKMRGWLMVVATLVASMAFQAGTSQQTDHDYYYEDAFMVFNTTAFGLALGSIILLMGENTFHGHFKLRVLRVFVVGAIFALAAAFCFAWFDSGVIKPLLFLGSLLVFLVFVTLLTWWYDRKRGDAIIWKLRSLSFGHLFRRAAEDAEDVHESMPR